MNTRYLPLFPPVLLLWLLTSCSQAPEVFSINNFSMTDARGRATLDVKLMEAPGIEGNWYGLEHLVRVEKSTAENELPSYQFGLIDTVQSPDTGSCWYAVDFLTISGHPYAEIISQGMNRSEHDFSLVTSTYARIELLRADTMIFRMMNSSFTEGWLKGKGYKYSVTSREKNNAVRPVYITEDLPRLATLLKELYNEPQAFKEADTLVRKKQSF